MEVETPTTQSPTRSREVSGPPTHTRFLPSFKPTSNVIAAWGDASGEEITDSIHRAYSEVVHWKPNMFQIPSGTAGKRFVSELSRCFNAFAMESDQEAIAMEAAMVLPALMLQKTNPKSKAKENMSCLQRRLDLWEMGDITNLLKEGRALQKSKAKLQPPSSSTEAYNRTTRAFSRMMMEGRVRAALRLLADNAGTGPLNLNTCVDEISGKTVKDILEEKHPNSQPACPETLLDPSKPTTFTLQSFRVSLAIPFALLYYTLKVRQVPQDLMHAAGDGSVLLSARNRTICVQPSL